MQLMQKQVATQCEAAFFYKSVLNIHQLLMINEEKSTKRLWHLMEKSGIAFVND
jgi:hypothetical protein